MVQMPTFPFEANRGSHLRKERDKAVDRNNAIVWKYELWLKNLKSPVYGSKNIQNTFVDQLPEGGIPGLRPIRMSVTIPPQRVPNPRPLGFSRLRPLVPQSSAVDVS